MNLADLPLYLLVASVVLFAYVVFGITGFGSTAVAMPILAHFLPLTLLVPLLVLLDLAAALIVGGGNREHISKPELKRMLPFLLVGIVLGVTVLVKVPQEPLKIGLGAFAILVGLYSIFNPGVARTVSVWWSGPAAMLGGAAAAVFGAGGPVYAAYLSGRLHDKAALRATISTLISFSATTRAIAYAIGGLLLHTTLLLGALLLAPCVWLGLKIGTHIHLSLTQEQMRRAVGGLMILTGSVLVVRTLLA